jgi:hypothetical protein
MLRKLSLISAVAACLFIPTAAVSARGGGGGGHGGGGHGGGGHGGGGGAMHSGGGMHMNGGGMHMNGAGMRGGRHVGGGGHGRRFWHGRWWNYGVGSCWRWTPAGYIWICG